MNTNFHLINYSASVLFYNNTISESVYYYYVHETFLRPKLASGACAINGPQCRPVTWGGEAPPRKFFSPLEKCVPYSLKILDIVQKIWALLTKLFGSPGVPSWLRACLSVGLCHKFIHFFVR